MTVRAIRWPKILGVFVAVFGTALALKASDFVFDLGAADPFDFPRNSFWPVFVAVVGFLASVILGTAVYLAREWARRILIGATAVGLALCLIYAYTGVGRNISALGQLQPQFILWTRLIFVGEALRAVSPPIFFLLVLLHPDVVRSFQPAAPRVI